MIGTLFLLIVSFFSASSLSYEGAGIQLYNPAQTHTLVVQGLRSGKWGWTKGHREPYDNSWLETAIREVKEEAGFIYGIHYTICNSFPEQWGKRLYWQGLTIQELPPPFHNRSEHRDIQWMPVEYLSQLNTTKDIQEWSMLSKSITCDF